MLKPAHILLPNSNVDLEKWGTLACDQFTSQPEYWQQAEKITKDVPSALHMILPEVYLEEPDVAVRIEAIHNTMEDYAKSVLTQGIDGYMYIERTMESGVVRQGLVGMVDLEDYTFEKGAKPLIRPSENTVVERIPPRLAVRRGALLESPHIMMLLDDDKCCIIEEIARRKGSYEQAYTTDLMLGGGHITGWSIYSSEEVDYVEMLLQNIATQSHFDEKYPAAKGQPPIAFAVGDGNHSLATAKAWWEEVKLTLTPQQQANHPARFCLVELVNVHSPAIEIEPIHRVVFGAEPQSFMQAAKSFYEKNGCTAGEKGEHQFTVCTAEKSFAFGVDSPAWPLAVGTIEAFLDEYCKQNSAVKIDYIHGTEAVKQLAQKGNIGIILPDFEKGDLFKGVVMGGVLPRKTFSMGHAEEKRYYMECRKIAE